MSKEIEIDDIRNELRIEPPITVDVAHDSIPYRCDVFRLVEILNGRAVYELVGTE
jgi:hypothetical protein